LKNGAVVTGHEAKVGAALFALFSRGHCLVVGVHGLPPAGLVAFDAGPHAGFAAPRPPKVAGLAKPKR
jgi:hypothetical protein